MPLLRSPDAEALLLGFWTTTRCMREVLARVGLDDTSLSVDVGGGLTTPLRWLPGRRVCVDPLAQHYGARCDLPTDRVEFVTGQGESLPLEDETVDLVVCTNCIDHTEAPERVIDEIERVLRPAGWLWFTCAIRLSGVLRNAGHPHALDRGAVGELIGRFEEQITWEEPWRGVRRFLLGDGPRGAIELGILVQKAEGGDRA